MKASGYSRICSAVAIKLLISSASGSTTGPRASTFPVAGLKENVAFRVASRRVDVKRVIFIILIHFKTLFFIFYLICHPKLLSPPRPNSRKMSRRISRSFPTILPGIFQECPPKLFQILVFRSGSFYLFLKFAERKRSFTKFSPVSVNPLPLNYFVFPSVFIGSYAVCVGPAVESTFVERITGNGRISRNRSGWRYFGRRLNRRS